MKDLEVIKNWKNSAKYAEFQFKLNQAKQKAFEVKAHMLAEENIHSTSNEQLESLVEVLKELDTQFVDDDFNFDYNYFSILGHPNDVLLEYVQKQKVWFIYLNRCLKNENYELAAKVRDAIQIEKRLITHLVCKYRPEMIQDDELFYSKVDIVEDQFYKLINGELEN